MIKGEEKNNDDLKKKEAEAFKHDRLFNVQSEMILLGNVINRLELVDDYHGCLQESDFYDLNNQQVWQFLCEYYRKYGTDWDATKVNGLHTFMKLEGEKVFPATKKEHAYAQLRLYRKLGTYGPADSEAYRCVKKLSMLRSLYDKGHDIERFLDRSDFKQLTVDDIAKMICAEVDAYTLSSRLRRTEQFGPDIRKRAMRFLEKPEFGLQTPFGFINEYMHGLCPNDLTMIGGLSNSGKGRFLMHLLVWLVAKEGQKVCLLSNEMTGEDFFKALVCTMMNLPGLYGKRLKIKQGDIVQSRFKDENGAYIERNENEDAQAFAQRLMLESPEYKTYTEILDWWEENFSDRFLFVSVADDYSTARLRREIRMAKDRGCSVIAYDTLKSYQSTEWGDLVQAATDLSEMIKADEQGITGLATFQLTDDVAIATPEELGSLKIARARHIMHLADNMIMFMHLNSWQKKLYALQNEELDEAWGEGAWMVLPDDKNIAAFRLVKNRRGGGKEKIFAVQTNLDYNRWEPIGELIRNEKQSKAG